VARHRRDSSIDCNSSNTLTPSLSTRSSVALKVRPTFHRLYVAGLTCPAVTTKGRTAPPPRTTAAMQYCSCCIASFLRKLAPVYIPKFGGMPNAAPTSYGLFARNSLKSNSNSRRCLESVHVTRGCEPAWCDAAVPCLAHVLGRLFIVSTECHSGSFADETGARRACSMLD
jgi:hypothetical protein